jgi:hypothetical protein
MTLSIQLFLDLASPLSYLAVYSPLILRASLDLTAPWYDFLPSVFRWIYQASMVQKASIEQMVLLG